MKLSDYTNSLTKYSVEWYNAAYSECWDAAYERACELVSSNSPEFNKLCLKLCEQNEERIYD